PLPAPAGSQTGTAGREPAEVAGGVRRTISNNCFLIDGGVRWLGRDKTLERCLGTERENHVCGCIHSLSYYFPGFRIALIVNWLMSFFNSSSMDCNPRNSCCLSLSTKIYSSCKVIMDPAISKLHQSTYSIQILMLKL
ncbi:unnamed protein product, partial [Gulo gulo]